MSTNTGIAPYMVMGEMVVGNVQAIVITSSPGRILLSPNKGDVRAVNANRMADDPELTKEQYFTSRYSQRPFSNSSV